MAENKITNLKIQIGNKNSAYPVILYQGPPEARKNNNCKSFLGMIYLPE
jgi:hypothetical protein